MVMLSRLYPVGVSPSWFPVAFDSFLAFWDDTVT